MLTSISFNEIEDFVYKKTNNKINLNISHADYSNATISYKPMAFLPSVNVNIQIREVCNSKITLSYTTNNAIDMIIKGLVAFLETNIPEDIVKVDTSNQMVTIYPNKIEQLQKPLEMIELQQIYFEEKNVCVEIKVK